MGRRPKPRPPVDPEMEDYFKELQRSAAELMLDPVAMKQFHLAEEVVRRMEKQEAQRLEDAHPLSYVPDVPNVLPSASRPDTLAPADEEVIEF